MVQSITIQSINFSGEQANILFTPDNDTTVINLGDVTLPYIFSASSLTPPREVYGVYTITTINTNCPYILNVPRPTPTPTPTVTPTKTQTPTPTNTPSPTPTYDPCKVSPTPTVTPTNTVTPTITPSNTPTLTPTPSWNPCITPFPTSTPTQSPQILCSQFTFSGINSTISGYSVTGDTAGWTSSAFSLETYSEPISLTFQIFGNAYLMGGFSYNPILYPTTYENITYGFYIQPNFLEIYENGGQVTVPGSMVITSSDVWKIEYDGINVKYYKNNILIYTSSNVVTQPLYVFFPILNIGVGVSDVCAIGNINP